MVRLGIIGASGRMGQSIILQCISNPYAQVTAAITSKSTLKNTSKDSSKLGAASGISLSGLDKDVILSSDLCACFDKVDVLIDFTNPESTLATLAQASKVGCAVVIGTTGFNAAQKLEIAEYAHKIPILFSANMSIGINLMYQLVEIATKALGATADIEIMEMHHRDKLDSPSGTALKMGELIADVLKRDLKQYAVFGREGCDGPRDQKTIGFATLRGGDVIGDHTAIFADIGERIEITHKATNRATFAQGALRAAIWLKEQKAGLYGMKDVLGF